MNRFALSLGTLTLLVGVVWGTFVYKLKHPSPLIRNGFGHHREFR